MVSIENNRQIIWVCGACGKWSDKHDGLMDVSCYINAIPCYKDKVRFKKDGRASRVLKNGIVEKGNRDDTVQS